MQIIKLDINPKGETPVLYVSQYDNGREFGIELVEGENAYNVPSGYSVQLNVRKTDSKLVTKTPETITGNILTFVTTTQMTACPGNNIASLTLKDANDIVITTLYFIIEVQRDVLAGGLDSNSEIDNLTQQIEDIAQEVIGEDYYNKSETDTLLADKADVSDLPDMSLYYNKTQTDTLLNAKADKSDTYTKAQVDTALEAKANTVDLATVATTGNYDDLINKPLIPAAQVQSDYGQADNTQVDYIKNKPDINAMIADALLAVMPVETATGNPCSFNTDIATALQSLSAEIVSRGGNGSPDSPIPIVGHSELNLTVNGDTFTVSFGQTIYGGSYDANAGKVRITWGAVDLGTQDWNEVSQRFNTTSPLPNAKVGNYIGCLCSIYETRTDVLQRVVPFSICIANNGYCYIYDTRFNDAASFKVAMDGIIVAYELATPIEIDVSELSVDTLVGVNNIVSDCNGDVTASYKVSIQKYIDDQ